ncbi:uncharacterized protein TNCV_1992901 [Trichonephila clavipes]|nr:uncharacterized protein TNCV_1992901 [Trichonephila clavipes]
MLTVTMKHFRNCDVAFKTRGIGMLTASVVLLHDNARPHTARRISSALTEFGWELFDHPPYSPDLAPQRISSFLVPQEITVPWCAFRKRRRAEDACHSLVPFKGRRVLRLRNTKVDPTIQQVSQFWWWICWKTAETLLYLLPIKMFMKV